MIPRSKLRQYRDSTGFTLIELAIVMFIVTLLLGGMLLPLSAQQDVRAYGDTQKVLSEARDALLGYAMANDRLPCPASSTSNGVEDRNPDGSCNHPYDGYFPAATLGLTPIDTSGFLVDGWGSDSYNRVRYSLTKANGSAFSTNTTSVSMKAVGMTALAPDLQVCSSGANLGNTGTPDATTCEAGKALATDAVAVIHSLGKNSASGGTSQDELPNVANHRAFVSGQQGSGYDDQMIWLSKSILFNRLVAAGRLP